MSISSPFISQFCVHGIWVDWMRSVDAWNTLLTWPFPSFISIGNVHIHILHTCQMPCFRRWKEFLSIHFWQTKVIHNNGDDIAHTHTAHMNYRESGLSRDAKGKEKRKELKSRLRPMTQLWIRNEWIFFIIMSIDQRPTVYWMTFGESQIYSTIN